MKGNPIMSYDLTAADLNDDVLATVREYPGLTLAKIAKRLRADVGAVKRSLAYLARDHYVALTREGRRETFIPADRSA